GLQFSRGFRCALLHFKETSEDEARRNGGGRELNRFVEFAKPSVRAILGKVKHSEEDVVFAIAGLEAHGFLEFAAGPVELMSHRVLHADEEVIVGQVGIDFDEAKSLWI